ncbi:MAG: amidohydrolase family protein [Holophagales bacterium]|nr:amidohydrolase family protein [Holophagales bacterium]MYD22975.1 amidohydrolase family protein [Holophagales bacterium]MYI32436.1 amidohydrolase family protein [Holophagales bacterium]
MRTRPSLFTVALSLALALPALPAAAQDDPHVFRGARLLPITGEPIDDGVLVVQGGRITEVGGSDTRTPRGAVEHDVSGKVLMPGLVDTHSHIGSVSGGDRSAPLHPDVRNLDSIDVASDSIWRARSGGITTVNIMSGSGHLMSGQTAYVKLRDGARTIEDWLYCDDPLTGICGGLKMANGTNSIGSPPFPGTRAKSAALVRNLYHEAVEYRDRLAAAEAEDDDENGGTPAKRDLRMEALVEVLDGKRIVQHHTHRHNDIATVLRLQEEFGFRVVVQHGTESWKVAEELAAGGVPVSITWIDAPGGKEETIDWNMEMGAILERAGVDVSFNTDDSVTDSRLLFRAAAIAVRYGMSREKAIEGLTLAPARALGLEDRIGSLEAGKDADFVILSGDPLSAYTKVEQTWVEGTMIYDRANPDHRKYAVGGYKVYTTTAHEDEMMRQLLERESH